ncbi:MAG TPA: sulfatase, partial [bacterium]|nr:sulfatase [bacterium]
QQASRASRPNILLIVGDDLGPQLHCYGDSIARTPSFDRLAKEGMRFTNAYVTQASCSPSRASLLTGLYPHQNGQIGLVPGFSMHPGIRTLPKILKEAGYRTGVIGKVHVLPDSAFAFDYVDEMKDEAAEEFLPPVREGDHPHRTNRRSKDVAALAELAKEFLEKERGRPFFLILSYPDPHRPFENQVAGIPAKPHTAAEVRPLPFLGIDTPATREDAAGYYNSIERLDHGIGLVLDLLHNAGLDSTTMVMALGDQGPAFSRAKGTCYEAGLKVPLLIRWPGRIPSGGISDALVSTLDLMPTILEWIHCAAPAGLEGKSLSALMTNSSAAATFRTRLFTEFNWHGKLGHYPRRAVRDEHYKLILNLEPLKPNRFKEIEGDVTWSESRRTEFEGTEIRRVYDEFASPPALELYDLKNDPWEMKNLAADRTHRETLERLVHILNEWRQNHGDSAAASSQDWNNK